MTYGIADVPTVVCVGGWLGPIHRCARPAGSDATRESAASRYALVAFTYHRTLRSNIVKSTYLASMVSAALLLGCAIANAQTSANQTADSSAMPPTSQSDTTKGNDLVDSSQAVPPNSQANPRSEGEDKASGNDLVEP